MRVEVERVSVFHAVHVVPVLGADESRTWFAKALKVFKFNASSNTCIGGINMKPDFCFVANRSQLGEIIEGATRS